MYTTRHTIVASSGTYTGTGMSKSPKTSLQLATSRAWDKLMAGDREHKCCSGIAVEDTNHYRNGQHIHRKLLI